MNLYNCEEHFVIILPLLDGHCLDLYPVSSPHQEYFSNTEWCFSLYSCSSFIVSRQQLLSLLSMTGWI